MMFDFFFIPEALIFSIWLRLPIKSTVRFRCVSKSWCASLSDPHFIYKNLTFSHTAANEEEDLLLVVSRERPHYSVVSHETLLATPLQVSLPPEVPIPGSSYLMDILTPPCDDLVCFNDDCGLSVGVWNLSTGETKMVPHPVFDGPEVFDDDEFSFSFITLGFGFDAKSKDYKIVQIWFSYHFEAYVYSLSSCCWRKVAEPNMLPRYCAGDVYSRSYRDGTFYWGILNLIVSFDMSSEVFNTISIPAVTGQPFGIQEICKLKEGSMLVITMNQDAKTRCMKEYEIWALLELGVTRSWTKLLVIDWGGQNDVPLGIWRNELILGSSNYGRPLIGDPLNRKTKEIQIDVPINIYNYRCLVWTKEKKLLEVVQV